MLDMIPVLQMRKLRFSVRVLKIPHLVSGRVNTGSRSLWFQSPRVLCSDGHALWLHLGPNHRLWLLTSVLWLSLVKYDSVVLRTSVQDSSYGKSLPPRCVVDLTALIGGSMPCWCSFLSPAWWRTCWLARLWLATSLSLRLLSRTVFPR